jgi:16S rRNA pseudouridine516 synthase
MAAERITQILFSQGFGTRRLCAGLLANGLVKVQGQVVDDPEARFATEHLQFEVEGTTWPFHAKALLMMHKPVGHECSQKPSAWPSVLSLLPLPLRTRGVQTVGRLDQDTTGLLLLTDDGTLLHRLTSPRHHVRKVYEVTAGDAVPDAAIERLLQGVVLHDDPKPARALACVRISERGLQLTIDEGRYHQVKRMLAAVGHPVTALHRSAFGSLSLPADLAPGQWRWLDAATPIGAG